MFGDEFDVTKGVLKAFPGGVGRWAELMAGPYGSHASHAAPLVGEVLHVARQLQREMPGHVAWKLNAGLRVGRYNMVKVRHLTDKADLLLSRVWGVEDAYEAAGILRDRTVFGNKE